MTPPRHKRTRVVDADPDEHIYVRRQYTQSGGGDPLGELLIYGVGGLLLLGLVLLLLPYILLGLGLWLAWKFRREILEALTVVLGVTIVVVRSLRALARIGANTLKRWFQQARAAWQRRQAQKMASPAADPTHPTPHLALRTPDNVIDISPLPEQHETSAGNDPLHTPRPTRLRPGAPDHHGREP